MVIANTPVLTVMCSEIFRQPRGACCWGNPTRLGSYSIRCRLPVHNSVPTTACYRNHYVAMRLKCAALRGPMRWLPCAKAVRCCMKPPFLPANLSLMTSILPATAVIWMSQYVKLTAVRRIFRCRLRQWRSYCGPVRSVTA
ncbi:Uncharacterised protein [Yersinia frederiksenii]|nr:Uncharacterised protein [Yersinia frederiksenii]